MEAKKKKEEGTQYHNVNRFRSLELKDDIKSTVTTFHSNLEFPP